MFDSSRPPLLVLPVNRDYTTVFSPHEGYTANFFSEDMSLVCYKDGWILPLSVQQQKYVSAAPLLVVRKSGRVTSSTSTTTKGYAHVFCQEDGKDLKPVYCQSIFPDKPDEKWMFVENKAIMIWFQYGNKTQFLGGSGHDVEEIYYGKLLIRKFEIQTDVAPGFDKKADIADLNAKMLRVESSQIYSGGWDIIDSDPEKHLQGILTENGLDRYQDALSIAFNIATGLK